MRAGQANRDCTWVAGPSVGKEGGRRTRQFCFLRADGGRGPQPWDFPGYADSPSAQGALTLKLKFPFLNLCGLLGPFLFLDEWQNLVTLTSRVRAPLRLQGQTQDVLRRRTRFSLLG
jgi:hypothetical protein